MEQLHLVLKQVQSGKTHYEILGVSQTATQDELRKSYFKLSKIIHPGMEESTTSYIFYL